ncbi:MAG: hypothetical protein Q8R92_03630 [Deltaproteobacteria bacterium]|nr:hypothetical protein [Deltaproteobacteria bacterium]
MGARGVLLEDQRWPKRCGHMRGKEVIDAAEHAAKFVRPRARSSEPTPPFVAMERRRGSAAT